MLKDMVNHQVELQPGTGYDPINDEHNHEVVVDYIHTVSGNSFITYKGWCVGYGCNPYGVSFSDELAPDGLKPSKNTLEILKQTLH